MFDASFYQEALPDRVTQECQRRPGDVPVVVLQLANGQALDLCHIVHLADTWMAVQHFRNTETCEDMDLAFLPYEMVRLVAVTLHRPESRRMGFSATGPVTSSARGGAKAQVPP